MKIAVKDLLKNKFFIGGVVVFILSIIVTLIVVFVVIPQQKNTVGTTSALPSVPAKEPEIVPSVSPDTILLNKCVGPDGPYNTKNYFRLDKDILMEECSGVNSIDGTFKVVLQSNGKISHIKNGALVDYTKSDTNYNGPYVAKRNENKLGVFDKNNKNLGNYDYDFYKTPVESNYVSITNDGLYSVYRPYTQIKPPLIDLTPIVPVLSNGKDYVIVLNKKIDFTFTFDSNSPDITKIIMKNIDPIKLYKYSIQTVLELLYNEIPNDIHNSVTLKFTSTPLIPAIAYAMGNSIEYSLPDINKAYNDLGKDITKLKNEMIGVMIHELTHVFAYSGPNQLYVEGVAEYIRMSSGFVQDWPGELPSSLKTWNIPYGSVPGYFFIYLDRQYPGFVKKLNMAFGNNKSVESVIQTTTKYKNIDELWIEYQKQIEVK